MRDDLHDLHDLHRQYTAGETAQEVLRHARGLHARGMRSVITSLGEQSRSAQAALAKRDLYCDLLDGTAGLNATVSVKPSDVGLAIDPALAFGALSDIVTVAARHGKVVEIDLEFRPLLDDTLSLCQALIDAGQSLRVTIQAALLPALNIADRLYADAARAGSALSLRIVTGSCYHKDSTGYITTLETSEGVTDQQFYDLIDLSHEQRAAGQPVSAVGTNDTDRLRYAAARGMELQFLKGEEDRDAYRLAEKLRPDGAGMAVYTAFGALGDPGVQSYLLRRIH